MTSPFRSLRWRLQAWHGLILLVAILALCATVHRLASFNQFQRIDHDLSDAEHYLIRGLMHATRPPGEPDVPQSPDVLLARLTRPGLVLPADIAARFAGTGAGHLYFLIRGPDGRILLHSDNAPADRPFLPPPTQGDFAETARTIGQFRESLRTSREGFASLVGRDISAERDEMHRFTISLVACGFGVWLLGLLGGWWLAGRAIKPIAAISRTASRIADGDLDERIDTAGTDDELDQLGRLLNNTFDRLRAAFERQRRFTADAAHELRTPVSILLSETQRLLRRDHTASEYREALKTCRDTAGRMRRLTEALLMLARQENELHPRRDALDLATLAADTATSLRPLADSRQVTLALDLAAAPGHGDPDALGILINNLVTNAIQHHRPEGGTVRLACASAADRVVLTVSDDGPGIPPADLPHIFERFHRADSARTGGSGHTGLGLAIAQTIAQNHKATLTAANNAPAPGATFTLTLPTT